MNRALFPLIGVMIWTSVATAEESAVVVRLTNGRQVSGRILEDGFDEAVGITMRRDDNGGRLHLRWDQMLPDDVAAIKRSRGFVGDEPPPVLIDAVEVETKAGHKFVGINRSSSDGKLLLERLGEVTPVPISQIRKIQNIQVDALELENPLTVYERRYQEVSPESAVDWYNLGLYAESLTLFDIAKECFDKTLEVEPDFSKANLITARKKLLDVKANELDAANMLRRIDSLMRKGSYATALELVAEFKQTWPTSKLTADLQKKESDIARRRRDSLLRDIKADFFNYLEFECDAKARDRELLLGNAMTWAEEDVFSAVVGRLAELYKTSEEEVLDLWANRGLSGSNNTYSYSGGTFILEEGAREGVVDENDPKKKDEGPQAQEEKKSTGNEIMDKIAAELEKKKKAREDSKNKKDDGSLSDVPPTPDEWWAAAPVKERKAFLCAWFCEHTKPVKVEIVRIAGRACTTCFGKGIFEYFANGLAASGNNNNDKRDPGKVACPRCKRLGFDRVVSAK